MVNAIENKLSNIKIKYKCEHCLKIAFDLIINNETGYITDEELIGTTRNLFGC